MIGYQSMGIIKLVDFGGVKGIKDFASGLDLPFCLTCAA